MDQCRICLEDDLITNMISPCLCRGHMKYIHRECLNQWIVLSENPDNKEKCPTCNFNYQYKQKPICHPINNIKKCISCMISKYIPFLIFNHTIIFCLANLIYYIRGNDNHIVVNKDLNLFFENYTIATFILTIFYLISMLIHFCFQKNKHLFYNYLKEENKVYFIFVLVIGLFCLTDFYIIGVFIVCFALQLIVKKYIYAIDQVNDLLSTEIKSLSDEQINLLNESQNSNDFVEVEIN